MQQQTDRGGSGGGGAEREAPAAAAAAIVGQVGRTFRGLKGSHVGAEAGQWLVIHSHSLDGWARVSHPDGRQGLFPYSCIDEASLRPAPPLLSLALMGKDGGPPPPRPRPPPPYSSSQQRQHSAQEEQPGGDDDGDHNPVHRAGQPKGKEKEDDPMVTMEATRDDDAYSDDDASDDGDDDAITSSDEDVDTQCGGGGGSSDDDADETAASGGTPVPRPTAAPQVALGLGRRETRYLCTDELEQLYSALFRRSLHSRSASPTPTASSAPSSSSSVDPPSSRQTPPMPTKLESPRPVPTSTAATEPAGAPTPQRADLEKKRLRLVEELIESEENYLRHLHVIQHVYLPPLVEKGLLVGEQERFLSSNVALFTDMHREFHNLLFRRFRRYSTATPQPLPPPIGDIFLTMRSYFGNYHRFCSGHAAALAALHKLNESSSSFRRCMRNIEASEAARGLTFAELLIAPVERICKYPLFLSELLDHTPRTAVDHQLLRAAQEQIVAVVKASNEAAARGANLERMRQIASYFSRQHLRDIMAPSRNFIHEGHLYAYDTQLQHVGKPVVVFLFSDLMVVADRLKSSKLLDPARRHKRCFSSMHCISLASARIINVVASNIAESVGQEQQRESLSAEGSSATATTGGLNDHDDHDLLADKQPQQSEKKSKGSLRRWRKDSESMPQQEHASPHEHHRFELQALWRSAEGEHVLRRYHFGAESEEEKRMWFRSIQKLINHALLKQMKVLPASADGDHYHDSAHHPTTAIDDDEEDPSAVTDHRFARRAATFSATSHNSNSGLLAKAKASTFRRKADRLRSSDPSGPSSAPSSPRKKAPTSRKDKKTRHAGSDASINCSNEEQPGQHGSGWVQTQMEEGGVARDEVDLLRDEIDQLKQQLHTLRPFAVPLAWDDDDHAPPPHHHQLSSTESPSLSSPSPSTPSAEPGVAPPAAADAATGKRQRRSQSATA